MALAKVLSCAVVGLDGELVDVEVDIAQGMPAFAIVGLPDAAVQEARERVQNWSIELRFGRAPAA